MVSEETSFGFTNSNSLNTEQDPAMSGSLLNFGDGLVNSRDTPFISCNSVSKPKL